MFAAVEKVYLGDTGGALYDGQQQVLYWADVSTELAFVVPSPTSHALAAGKAVKYHDGFCLTTVEFFGTGIGVQHNGSNISSLSNPEVVEE